MPDAALRALSTLLDAELHRPLPAAVTQLAALFAARAGGGCAAVLYYGSTLRDDTLDGVLDFYVLLDDVRRWPGSRATQLANRWLPPNVGYLDAPLDDGRLRAKYAVMSVAQFRAGMSLRALDTTLWARFCQPCACAWSRGDADRLAVCEAVAAAARTAAHWAALLGPARGRAGDYWRALFGRTYGAELRVERAARGGDIVARDTDRYARLLPAAWQAEALAFDEHDGVLAPRIDAGERARAARRWAWRQHLGKPLNVLRLLKAACTFDGAADYVAWKVERHSGYRLELRDWQRRHPLLAAPGIYLRLRRVGVLR
jgi:hypothetical protein